MSGGGQEARAAVTDALRDATLTKPQFGVVDDQASNAVDLSTDMWRALTKIRVIEKPLGVHAGQYKAAGEPKERLIIKDAIHTDLYDRVEIIPFVKISDFFIKNLK